MLAAIDYMQVFRHITCNHFFAYYMLMICYKLYIVTCSLTQITLRSSFSLPELRCQRNRAKTQQIFFGIL